MLISSYELGIFSFIFPSPEPNLILHQIASILCQENLSNLVVAFYSYVFCFVLSLVFGLLKQPSLDSQSGPSSTTLSEYYAVPIKCNTGHVICRFKYLPWLPNPCGINPTVQCDIHVPSESGLSTYLALPLPYPQFRHLSKLIPRLYLQNFFSQFFAFVAQHMV